ncbi:hypothetical protein D3C73_1031710 [compost metagenome]
MRYFSTVRSEIDKISGINEFCIPHHIRYHLLKVEICFVQMNFSRFKPGNIQKRVDHGAHFPYLELHFI